MQLNLISGKEAGKLLDRMRDWDEPLDDDELLVLKRFLSEMIDFLDVTGDKPGSFYYQAQLGRVNGFLWERNQEK